MANLTTTATHPGAGSFSVECPNLLQHHLDHLRDSGIPNEVIRERGYESILGKKRLADLGFSSTQQRISGLLIPLWGVDRERAGYTYRPDHPRVNRQGKSLKYENPTGSSLRLDCPPMCQEKLGDPAVPLYITEGVKKGDALAGHGVCVLVLPGVWGFKSKNSMGGTTFMADWDYVTVKGREVFIVFDSDVATKPPVRKAMLRLSEHLRRRGAKLYIVTLPQGTEKVGVDDYLVAGHTIDDLWNLATSLDETEAENRHILPVIQVNGKFLREITAQSVAALSRTNEEKQEIFNRGGALVRLHRDEHGLAVQTFTAAALKGVLDRAADYMVQKDGDERPARPPDDVVLDILSLAKLPFPELRGIALSPVVIAGGRLVSTTGYDQESGLYLDFGELNIRERMPVRDAVRYIDDELLADFPLADDASRAHSIALIIQPFVRHVINDPTPLYLIDAPSQGTGKGLEAEVVSETAIGRAVEVMSMPRSEEETRKRITALLLAGHPLISLDNVHRLDSTALCSVLTCRVWEDRLLGRSRMVRLPNLATWMATGNNVELSAEMTRRVVLIRLDAGVERPEERTDFRHPQLLRWVRSHRSELVTAALSIVQAWLDAGMPPGEGTMGRFEEWVRVLGGILQVANIDGFLSNRQRLYEDSDHESREWVAFCTLWWERFGTSPVTAGDLFELLKERRLLLDVLAGRSALAAQQRLGHALANRRHRIFGTWRIRSAGRSSETGSTTYRLEETSRRGGASKTPKTTETTVDKCSVEAEVSGVSGVSQIVEGAENPEDNGWQEV